jgi:DNA-binding transcriptional regulator YbjK
LHFNRLDRFVGVSLDHFTSLPVQGRVGELNRRNADLLDQLTRLQAILEASGIAQGANPDRAAALSRESSRVEPVYEDARYGRSAPVRQASLHSVVEHGVGSDDEDDVGYEVEWCRVWLETVV